VVTLNLSLFGLPLAFFVQFWWAASKAQHENLFSAHLSCPWHSHALTLTPIHSHSHSHIHMAHY